MTGAWLTNILLIGEILYFVVASAVPSLPGWKMFASTSPLARTEISSTGEGPIDVRKFLPQGSESLGGTSAQLLLTFICKKSGKEASNVCTLKYGDQYFEARPPDCVAKAK